MNGSRFVLVGASAIAIAAAGGLVLGEQQGGQNAASSQSGQSASFRDCAKACSDCQRECNSCATHCAEMLARGNGQAHYTTLRTCLDCADICATASQIASRSGPFAAEICGACAEACKRCGEACRQHSGDKRMQDCAEQCKRCEQACRDMVRTANQASSIQSR